MKKFISIIVLCLLWSGSAFAEIITLEKCYENTYKQEFTQRFKGKVYEQIYMIMNSTQPYLE